MINSIIDATMALITLWIVYKYSNISFEKNFIDFSVQIFIPEKLPFAQRDICIMIGNALDNAIEAAKYSTVPFIELFLGIRKEAFIIVIKNSFIGDIKRDSDGNLLTIKADKKTHGYGLSSIERVVEKYQGQVIIETEEHQELKDKEFILTMILNMKNIEL